MPATVAEPAPVVRSVRNAVTEEADEEGDDFTSVGKGGKALGITADSVFKNLQTIQESRGKKVYLPVLPSD